MESQTQPALRVQFWGTRGSLAKPGRSNVKYGGNTSCVQVTSAAGTLLVLDCGTGIHDLGRALVASGKKPIRGSILIGHTHWDHIQGLPFFAPLFVPGNEWDIYAPRGIGQSLRETLAGQMQYTYFPISLEAMGSKIRYHELVEGVFNIEDIKITTRYLNHPALTLGYRMESGGATVVYACDHEPFSKPAEVASRDYNIRDQRHVEFLSGADLVVHDSQYTAAEYPQKIGWGHSTMEYAMDVCRAAGAKRLAFTHHDPLRDDDAIDAVVAAVRAAKHDPASTLEVFAAADGMAVDVTASAAKSAEVSGTASSALASDLGGLVEHTVLLAVANPAQAGALAEAARSHRLRVLEAKDGPTAWRLVRAEHPSLVIVEQNLPGNDDFALCRALRGATPAEGNDVPVVVLADTEDRDAGQAVGVTDWLTPPFSPTFARTHMQAWIMRTSCRWQRAAKPVDEANRLAALRALNLLDTAPQERFERITRVAKALADVPIAYISFVDENRQWFMSCQGLSSKETPREVAFCAHVVVLRKPLIIPDALLDPRFAENPLVTIDPRVRFYAGFPLILPDGSCIGTLCFVDTRPRQFPAESLVAFADLAEMAKQEILAKVERA
jgi:phosphoribosyl 1,2-cyclic phosphodiesterase/CheY-like chemotaxis protein